MTLRVKVWIGAGITFVIVWLLHPFYVRSLEAVMEKRGWEQGFNRLLDSLPSSGAEMSIYLSSLFDSPFWIGAFLVLAIWGLFEAVYARMRYRQSKAQLHLAGEEKPSAKDDQEAKNLTAIADDSLYSNDAEGGTPDTQAYNNIMANQPTKLSLFPVGLYVGEMGVDCNKLITDFTFEFWVRGYNATDAEISFSHVEGTLEYKFSPANSAVERIPLPLPQVLSDRSKTKNLTSLSEFFLVLEQRIPGLLARTMGDAIEAGEFIDLEFDDLDLLVSPSNDTTTTARLPLWNGLRLRRDPDWIRSGRIIYATGNLQAGNVKIAPECRFIPHS